MENKNDLLIEDNPDVKALTLEALARNHIRNDVVVAHDGVEALDFLFGTGIHAGCDLSVAPGAILLDLKLPRMDGLEVSALCEAIRARGCYLRSFSLHPVGPRTDSGITDWARTTMFANRRLPRIHGAIRTLGLYWLILNQYTGQILDMRVRIVFSVNYKLRRLETECPICRPSFLARI